MNKRSQHSGLQILSFFSTHRTTHTSLQMCVNSRCKFNICCIDLSVCFLWDISLWKLSGLVPHFSGEETKVERAGMLLVTSWDLPKVTQQASCIDFHSSALLSSNFQGVHNIPPPPHNIQLCGANQLVPNTQSLGS